MARLELLPEVAGDFIRILDHLDLYAGSDGTSRIREIIAALAVLELNPLIGRPVADDERELIMGRRSHGYVARYRYIEPIDTVYVLAIRSQREAGYSGSGETP